MSEMNPSMSEGLIPSPWRWAQAVLFVVGGAIFFLLIFAPRLGIHALWNVLVPVAPALVLLAPGLWRNICPLATANQVVAKPLNGGGGITASLQGKLLLVGIALLFVIIPIRHPLLNENAAASAIALATMMLLAVGAGRFLPRKSGWCSGLCPIHPVERLYGTTKVVYAPGNGHCSSCKACVPVCTDNRGRGDGVYEKELGRPGRIATLLMCGVFPGYVFGWFQVADVRGSATAADWVATYAWPLGAGVVTLVLWSLLRLRCSPRTATGISGAATLIAYYFHRLPALVGFGPHPGDGMLVDLSGTLPASFEVILQVLVVALCVGWFLGRQRPGGSWFSLGENGARQNGFLRV